MKFLKTWHWKAGKTINVNVEVDHIVVDIEIQKTIEETPGGWDATDKLGVSCAVVYEYLTNRFRVYGPDDVKALQDRLLAAHRVTGFNTWKFDFPVIWGLAGRERVEVLRDTSDDLLRRIWMARGLDPDVFTDQHKSWGLDRVCQYTIGSRKSGTGADAPGWFQAGNWSRLVDYCIQDVALTRDLSNFIELYGRCSNGITAINIPGWQPGQG